MFQQDGPNHLELWCRQTYTARPDLFDQRGRRRVLPRQLRCEAVSRREDSLQRLSCPHLAVGEAVI